MEKETLLFLLQKLNAGTLTDEERAELTAYFNKKQSRETIISALKDVLAQHSSSIQIGESRFDPLILGILKADAVSDIESPPDEAETFEVSETKRGTKKVWWIMLIVLLVAAGAAAYFFYYKPGSLGTDSEGGISSLANDIPPGGDKAVLTISDGSTIALDSLPDGYVMQEGNAKITKASNGDLKYSISSEMGGAILFNTVTTPRGGQFQVILSDGSRIKLNSASSVTYPVAFVGPERSVTITGEAFFEVAANQKVPFKVRVYDMEVEVQGTQFNINAYLDEPGITTTLLNGSLKLTKNSKSHTLRNEQQGIFDNQGNFSLENNVDANETSAWKNGKFQFNNSNLPAVLRQLARWYNVEIVYETGIPQNQPVYGEIRRNAPFSEVVKLLEKSEVHCKIKGNKLVILP